MKPTALELMLTFDEPDVATIERAVAAYLAKATTRREMAKRVIEVAQQYDTISQGFAFAEVEDAIGEEVREFWAARKKKGRRGR